MEEGVLHERSHILSRLLFLLFVMIIIAAGLYFGGGAYIIGLITEYIGEVEVVDESHEVESVSIENTGYIYYVDDDPVNRRGIPYVYDVAAGISIQVPHDSSWYVRNLVPTNTGFIFQRALFDSESPYAYPYSEYVELVRLSENADEMVIDTRDVGEARGLQWSAAANMFAYYGLSPEATADPYSINIVSIENWNVLLVHEDGTSQAVIENAIRPTWSPDGRYVYFLSTEGIYRYEVETGETEEIFVDKDFALASASGLALSADGSMLVLSSPVAVGVFVYALSEDGSKVIDSTFYRTKNGHSPYSVTMHPDALQAAFVTYESTNNGTEKSTLVAIDLSTGVQEPIFSIPVQFSHDMLPVWSSIDPESLQS